MNRLLDVPHIKQSGETACGAAALAMVYRYYGKNEELESEIFNRLKKSRPNTNEEYLLTLDLARDGERLKFSYFFGEAVMDSIELEMQPINEFLSLGIPVIVCQRIDRESQYGHFRVVTGLYGNEVSLNDPLDNEPKIISLEEFLKLWERTTQDEVTGGAFFAIFNKDDVTKDSKFLVRNFESSVSSFQVSNLNFIDSKDRE